MECACCCRRRCCVIVGPPCCYHGSQLTGQTPLGVAFCGCITTSCPIAHTSSAQSSCQQCSSSSSHHHEDCVSGASHVVKRSIAQVQCYQCSVNNTLHTLQSSRCTIMASAAPSPPSSPSSSEPIPIESVELKPLIKVRGATGKAEGKTKQEGGADGVRGAIGGAMDAVRDGLSDNLRNIRRATAGVIIVSTVGALYFSRPVRYASIQADLALFGLRTSSLKVISL